MNLGEGLDQVLLAEAKSLRINVPKAAEAGLARAVAEKQAELWLQENQAALVFLFQGF